MAAFVQGTGVAADNATSISRAYAGNVTAGSLLSIVVSAYKGVTNDPFVLGDITKSAGTATLSAFSIDVNLNENASSGTTYVNTAIISAIVTGTGSCTIQAAGMPAGSYSWIAVSEFSGNWDGSRFEDSSTSQNTGASGTAPNSGDADSAGAGLFVGGCGSYSSANPSSFTEDAAFSSIFASTNGSTSHVGEAIYRIVGSATTDSASWTAPTGFAWNAAVAVYKEAAGGGLVVNPLSGRGGAAAQPLIH